MQYGILQFNEPKRDTSRKILHVDMDAFYASIEMRDNPKIRNKPVVIAKHPKLTAGRGIVSTCNYEARKYGIHSAMSAQEAYTRCPHAVFIPGNLSYYKEISLQIRQIFLEYTDLVEPLSLDEAYLDVSHNKKAMKSATFIAQRIQKEIYEKTALTCSVGVSYNKFIAKIASDYKKPNGITVIDPDKALDFLKALDIKDFYGVGAKSVPIFHELGIYNGADLYKMSLDDLIKYFGKMGYSLYFKVRGIHDSAVKNSRQRKSIGRERTFSKFLEFEAEVIENFKRLVYDIDKRHHIKDLKAHTVTIKIRYDNFETISRQVQLADPIDSAEMTLDLVEKLWYDHGDLSQSVRLLGVTFSNFEDSKISSIILPLE